LPNNLPTLSPSPPPTLIPTNAHRLVVPHDVVDHASRPPKPSNVIAECFNLTSRPSILPLPPPTPNPKHIIRSYGCETGRLAVF
jgi:hypothetical protein